MLIGYMRISLLLRPQLSVRNGSSCPHFGHSLRATRLVLTDLGRLGQVAQAK
jgi:hypothetical protein